MVRIKVCGITRPEDAYAAIDCGVHALGFVFYRKSRRAVDISQLDWLRQLPPFVQLTALFVNPEADWVNAVISQLPIELLQFHGKESADFCRQFNHRYIKAVPMENQTASSALAFIEQYPDAAGFLLDNYGETEIGGSGTAFDWNEIPSDLTHPLIVAGGLAPDNVAQVIAKTRPYAVDVSSGVEVSPGIKDAKKMAQFVAAVQSV